jgi:hypothetical protein
MTKKLNCFELGAWELFGIWDSVFGISYHRLEI